MGITTRRFPPRAEIRGKFRIDGVAELWPGLLAATARRGRLFETDRREQGRWAPDSETEEHNCGREGEVEWMGDRGRVEKAGYGGGRESTIKEAKLER